MKYQGYTIKFWQVTRLSVSGWGDVVKNKVWDICLFNGKKLITPLIETGFLKSGYRIYGGCDDEQSFIIESRNLATWEYEEACPDNYELDPFKAESIAAEIHKWNSELPNWERKYYNESYLDFDDSDERRVVSSSREVWVHPDYPERSSKPGRKELEQELNSARKGQWVSQNRNRFKTVAEELWIEENEAALDAAIADGGQYWNSMYADIEKKAASIRMEYETRKNEEKTFQQEAKKIFAKYGEEHFPYFSGKEVWVKSKKKTYSQKFTELDSLEAFLKELNKKLPSGKPLPKKRR